MLEHNRFVARTAVLAILSYVTVMLTCGYAEAKHLPEFAARSLETALATSENSTRSDEELCEILHEQLFIKQAFSVPSITANKISHVLLTGAGMLGQSAELDGFRPPGSAIAPNVLSFFLYSVLRI
jgi:hypothetical protein